MIKDYIKGFVSRLNEAFFLLFKKLTYHSLEDFSFTMDKYIKLVVDYDFDAIKRIKLPIPKAYLFRIYEDISIEYATLSNNQEILAKIKGKDALRTMYNKYQILISCLFVINSPYAKQEDVLRVKKLLKKNRVSQEGKMLEAEIKSLHVRIEDMIAKNDTKKQERITKSDFFRMFAILEENGFSASVDMSVLSYIQKLELYRKKIKNLEKLKNNG